MPEDLVRIQERMRSIMALRGGPGAPAGAGQGRRPEAVEVARADTTRGPSSTSGYRTCLLVCTGTGCVSNRSLQIRDALVAEVRKQGLEQQVQVVPTGCNGFCANGPIVVVKPDDTFYQRIAPEDVPSIVADHCREGKAVPRLMYTPEPGQPVIPRMADIPFFGRQKLVALANRGIIDPENIEEYIGRGGYQALAKALDGTPEAVIAEITASGLRGRGVPHREEVGPV